MIEQLNPIMQIDITAAIAKNLSAEVGAVLQAELDDLERLRKKDNANQIALAEAALAIKRHVENLAKHESISTREVAVVVRENAVGSRERERDVFEAKLKAAEAEKRADVAISIVNAVFRSPVFTRSLSENSSGQIPVPQGSYAQSVTSSKNSSETVSET